MVSSSNSFSPPFGFNLGQILRHCRALQLTNEANFEKRFLSNLVEKYKSHNSIRQNIIPNFVTVELEQDERLGGEVFYNADP